MDLQQGLLKEIIGDRVNGDHKTLGLSVIFGLHSRFAAVAAHKRRGGRGAATFRWCGYDWRDLLYLG